MCLCSLCSIRQAGSAQQSGLSDYGNVNFLGYKNVASLSGLRDKFRPPVCSSGGRCGGGMRSSCELSTEACVLNWLAFTCAHPSTKDPPTPPRVPVWSQCARRKLRLGLSQCLSFRSQSEGRSYPGGHTVSGTWAVLLACVCPSNGSPTLTSLIF